MTKNLLTFLLLGTILLVSVSASAERHRKLEELLRPHINPVVMKEKYNISEVEFFSVLGHATSWLYNAYTAVSDFGCNTCRSTFNYLLSTNTGVLLTVGTFVGEEYCIIKGIADSNVCMGAVKEMAPVVVDSLLKHYLDPDFLCPMIHLCSASYQNLDLQTYINDTLRDKPAKEDPVPTGRKTYKLAHITDVHVDFDYAPGSEADCLEPVCCQNIYGPPKRNDTSAGYWGSLKYKCDLPSYTVLQGLDFLKSLEPDMIVWTGDSIRHTIWKQSSQENINATLWIGQELKKRFNSSETQIFPIDGNHECFPVDNFDYSPNSTAGDPIKVAFSEDWKEWIGEDAAAQVRKQVFYSTYNEKYNIRLIALDTNTCQSGNFFLLENPTDPAGMLEWLKGELQDAEDKGQFAYIIGHIPSAACMYQWAARYEALVDRYSYTIRGQFFGHTHSDQFQVFYAMNDSSKPVGTQYIAPSMTTYVNKHPSIRIFEVDADTGIPVKIRQYRLNMTKANSLGAVDKLTWDEAYDTSIDYNLTHLAHGSMHSLRNQIRDDPSGVGQKFIDNFYTQHRVYYNSTRLYCQMLATDREQNACINGQSIDQQTVSILEKLSGPWFERIKKHMEEVYA